MKEKQIQEIFLSIDDLKSKFEIINENKIKSDSTFD